MNQDIFVKEKKEYWESLSSLLDQIRSGGADRLSSDEIMLIGSLYRKTCSDLSYARSKKYSPDLVSFLNQLARKAYGYIYLNEKKRKGNLLKFFRKDFPELIRANFAYIMAAILIFVLTTALGFIWDRVDSGFAKAVVPHEFLEIWDTGDFDDSAGSASFPIMSAGYLTRNFKVGMNAFILGIFLGLGTLYVLIYNGLIMGAVTSLVIRGENHHVFFNFVLSHAFIELMAIFICGGAGFMVARALVAPGDLTVRDALNKYGRPAVKLVVGTVPMFLLAGIIESSYSRMNIHIIFKIIFALFSVILMSAYFMGISSTGNKLKKSAENKQPEENRTWDY